MLDYRFIKEHVEEIRANVADRRMTADPALVANLFDRRNEALKRLEDKRRRRNEVADAMKGKLSDSERQPLVAEGKSLKEEIAALESECQEIERALELEAARIPNMAHPDAPKGGGDEANVEVKRVGTPRTFSFPTKDHVQLGQELDIIDFDTATRVSGTKFYYLKNEGVFLELAFIRFALDELSRRGFVPFMTPDVAKTSILEGIGFNPRGAESNVYALEGEDTCLIGTAEITLGGYLSGTVIPRQQLPLRYAGVSHCFRREAGAAGQFSKGLYRVHQFTKIEMFAYTTPEESEAMHEELRTVEEELFARLEIPFRVVDTCTADLGAPAFRKWDLEAWMPGRNDGEYGEVTSTSNCTDYQARRLDIRFKDSDGKNRFVHTLNGTAIAVSRAMIAVLENFQQEDGSVRLPEALVPYAGFAEIRPKKRA